MIFASVGTSKYPFRRMVETIDQLAPELEEDVFIQAGDTLSVYTPEHAEYAEYVTREEYDRLLEDCDLFVSHSGTGSIISAVEAGTPVVLFPREADRGEHLYDFIETARGWEARAGVEVVETTEALERVLREGDVPAPEYDGRDEDLGETIADILEEKAEGAPGELTVFCPTPPGGHLTQLLRLEGILADYDVHYLTWDEEITGSIEGVELIDGYHIEELPDPGTIKSFLVSKLQVVRLLVRHRPDVVLSTGGGDFVFFTAYVAKLVGADVIHVESLTRFDSTSTTGRILYPVADRFFTQHAEALPHYGEKAEYAGSLF